MTVKNVTLVFVINGDLLYRSSFISFPVSLLSSVVFPWAVQWTVLLNMRGRGCLCSPGGNGTPPWFCDCVSSPPNSPHYVCTFSPFVAFFFFLFPLLPIPKPTATLSCSATTHQTSSHYSWNNGTLEIFSMYLWIIIFARIDNSLECDNWFGYSVLFSVLGDLLSFFFFSLFVL